MKRLLVLGGSEFQIPLIKTAKKLGIYVGVVDIHSDAQACQYADEVFEISLKDKEGVLDCALKFQPDGITVGMVDVAIPAYAYVTTELGLPGMDIDTAIKATDKFEMIKAFEASGVPCPWFRYVPKNEINDSLYGIGFPAIVKPVDMAGSRGIYLVNNISELMSAMKHSSCASDRGDIIIEEYMEGPEVSVEIIVKDGIPYVIQVTDKTTSGAPHFAEIGHLQPSQLPETTVAEIRKVASMAAKAIGLKNSLGHAELKITSQGPKMVEIGARAGGDGIAEQLIELSTGVSFSKVAIEIAFGERISIPKHIDNKASCIRFILSKNGILQSIQGVEKANEINNIKEVKITGIIGQHYEDTVDNSGRIGYVISSAENAIDAKVACDDAINTIIAKYAH